MTDMADSLAWIPFPGYVLFLQVSRSDPYVYPDSSLVDLDSALSASF